MSVSVAPAARHTQARAAPSPTLIRALFMLVVALALITGFVASNTDAAARAAVLAGPDLTRLMRAMAGLKALIAVGLAAGVVWRLGSAVSAPRFAAYAAACAAMSAGPGLIWHMQYVVAGAVALHGGLLACIVLLWRDPAVGQRLEAAIASRRARRAAVMASYARVSDGMVPPL